MTGNDPTDADASTERDRSDDEPAVDGETDFDPDSDLESLPETNPATDSGSDGIDRTGPLSDLAATIDDRRTGRDDATHEGSSRPFDDLFEREEVPEIDSDRLWERLESDDVPETPDEDREIREIDKGSYCHQCEHFAAPPAVACTREGTDILELTSMETFRVADCPIVLEDEELERRY